MLEDYLDEDEPITGQKYALISFVSPENVLEKKELFFFERFLQNFEVEWKVKGMETFLADTIQRINRDLEEKAAQLEKDGNTEVADVCRKNYVKVDGVLESYQN